MGLLVQQHHPTPGSVQGLPISASLGSWAHTGQPHGSRSRNLASLGIPTAACSRGLPLSQLPRAPWAPCFLRSLSHPHLSSARTSTICSALGPWTGQPRGWVSSYFHLPSIRLFTKHSCFRHLSFGHHLPTGDLSPQQWEYFDSGGVCRKRGLVYLMNSDLLLPPGSPP